MKRREFVIAGAGAIFAPAASGGMFVSLNGTLTGKMDWLEFARLASKCGFGGVDVNVRAAMKEGVEATRALLKKLRLRPSAVDLPIQMNNNDEKAFEEGLKQLGEVAAFAAAIDCPRMTTWLRSSSALPKEEWRKILGDRFRAISLVLAPHKVRLGLEFLGPLHIRKANPHPFIWRMDEMLEFAKECGPNMGLLLDAWHWHHAEATVGDILAAGKQRIVHVHVSDSAKLPPEEVRDNQRIMPGAGVINLVAFFQALEKVGYEDGISPEVIGGLPKGTPPEEGAKQGLNATVAVMRKAGVAVG